MDILDNRPIYVADTVHRFLRGESRSNPNQITDQVDIPVDSLSGIMWKLSSPNARCFHIMIAIYKI